MPIAVFPKCYLEALLVQRTMTVAQWVDLASEHLDVDGLELYSPLLEDFTPHEIDRLAQHLGRRGLAMPMMCHSPDFTVADPEARATEIAQQRRAIRLTAELGGRYCRVLSGQRYPGLDRRDGIDRVVAAIREVLPDAERDGITLTMENHYKDGSWLYPEFAQRLDILLQIFETVGPSEHFAINFDPSNALIAGDDPVAVLRALLAYVATMHASDRYMHSGTLHDLRALEGEPATGYASLLHHGVIGQGLNDYDAIFAELRQHGFEGWISIEDGDDPNLGLEHLAQSAEFLRKKMTEYGLR
jgi:sugar phosphate isomerase/epimerase